MYKSCKTEQSARRQREIEEKFIQMLAIRHFDEIKIADLCAELNIPRKAFYRYFESKESVLKASIDHILLGYEVYRSNSSPTPRRTVSSELERYFEFWLTKPRVTLLNGTVEYTYQYTISNRYKSMLSRAPYYDGTMQQQSW